MPAKPPVAGLADAGLNWHRPPTVGLLSPSWRRGARDAGEGTKIVFTGDIRQIDQPSLDSLSNRLSYLINRMMGQSIYAHVTLEKRERSALADLASERL